MTPRLLIAFSLLFPAVAAASCGLEACPRPAHQDDAPVLQADVRTRWVAFDAGEESGGSGSYTTLSPRVLFRPHYHWTFGVEVPVTRLQSAGESYTGLSNPLVTALYARRLSHAWSGEAGLQLEVPAGNSDHGLADDHYMVLPWIGLRRDIGPEGAWQASGLVGYSVGINEFGPNDDGQTTVLDKVAAPGPLAKTAHNGVDHGDGTLPVVNPHGDRELQWRAGLTRLFARSAAETFLTGQADVSYGISHPMYYARAGLSWEYRVAPRFTAQLTGDVPLTTQRRSEGALGVGVRTGW